MRGILGAMAALVMIAVGGCASTSWADREAEKIDRRIRICEMNLAHGQTVGFREVQFDGERTTHSPAQGPAIKTCKTLDVMIEGDGYFSVILPVVPVLAYTRCGDFCRGPDGYLSLLVNDEYLRVEPAIRIPDYTIDVQIDPDGTVLAVLGNAETKAVGHIVLTMLEHPEQISAIGAGLYVEQRGCGAVCRAQPMAKEQPFGTMRPGRLKRGYVEGSNVDVERQRARLDEYEREMWELTQRVNRDMR
jgi:flagellar basal body rod protein FlgG